MVRDKFSSAPRGFAFVHYGAVAEAAKALQALQGAALAGQDTPLRLAFAKDRVQPAATGPAADALAVGGALLRGGVGEWASGYGTLEALRKWGGEARLHIV